MEENTIMMDQRFTYHNQKFDREDIVGIMN